MVKQTETAAMKAAGMTSSGKSGTFDRRLAAVYTSSTIVEDSILDSHTTPKHWTQSSLSSASSSMKENSTMEEYLDVQDARPSTQANIGTVDGDFVFVWSLKLSGIRAYRYLCQNLIFR